MADTAPQQGQRRASDFLPQHHPCHHEGAIARLESRDEAMQNTLESINHNMQLILTQITKIPVHEEKLIQQLTDITRAHAKVGELDKDHSKLSKEFTTLKTQILLIAAIMVLSLPSVGSLITWVYKEGANRAALMENRIDVIYMSLANVEKSIDSINTRLDNLKGTRK